MFSHLTSQLRLEVETVRKILLINDGVRDLLLASAPHLATMAELPSDADENMMVAYEFRRLIAAAPQKLDWQIYDHCAAVTRLYAAYAHFVGDLVSEYATLLPKLYSSYADLPRSVATQHRVGIGQILAKIGDKGRYRKLEEQTIVHELATGLSGASGYSLLADAFLIYDKNLRLEVLVRLFSSLGFRDTARFVNSHPVMTAFMKAERSDNSSPQKELQDFIDYRNEAAHRKVDNLLSIDAIGGIGHFIVALGEVLAGLVEDGVLRRRMDLGHYALILDVKEVHYDGFVVVGPLSPTTLKKGDEVVVFGQHAWKNATVESIQVNNALVEQISGNGAVEVGVHLNKRVAVGTQLRRLQVPGEAPVGIQLELEDAFPTAVDIADTDIVDAEALASDESVDISTAGDESL